MILRKNVILRSAQQARLEGRTMPAYASLDARHLVKPHELARILQ